MISATKLRNARISNVDMTRASSRTATIIRANIASVMVIHRTARMTGGSALTPAKEASARQGFAP